LSLWRDGKTIMLPVTVGELPGDGKALASARRAGDAPASAGNTLGIVAEALSADQRKQLGITDDEGIMVTRINGDAASRAGLVPGDVILRIGRKPVKTVGDFNAMVNAAKPEEPVMVLVRRDEQTQFLVLRVPKTRTE
ncbi:MAG: PDZ domain-containing protein, partial [Dokdonella sp.]